MLRIRFQLDSTLGKLAKLVIELGVAVEPLLAAAAVVDRAIQRNFDEEGRPERWWPLEPAYALAKGLRFPGRGILERTGLLRRSISTHLEMGAFFAPAEIVARTDIPYAAIHQFGGPHFPARPFLILTDEDRMEMARAMARSFSKLASQS